MSIAKNKVLQKLFTSGEVVGFKIVVDRTPRIIADTPANTFIVNPKTGLSDGGDGLVLNRLKEGLTFSDLHALVNYVVVDRLTQDSEEAKLHIPLHEYGRNVYEGVLHSSTLGRDGLDVTASPESRAGIDARSAASRLIFNLVGSVACETEGYDRLLKQTYVDIALNSTTGAYRASKNDHCRASYAPLAQLKVDEVNTEELLELILNYAPEAGIVN